MMIRFSFKATILLGVCLLPFAVSSAHAGGFDIDDSAAIKTEEPAHAGFFDSQVTAGVQYQDESSAKFGRYNGSPDKGFAPTLNFNINDYSAWDSGDTSFLHAEGNRLTLDQEHMLPDFSALLKFGEQGTWTGKVFYDNITYVQSLGYQTPYSTSGSLLKGPTINQAGGNAPGFSGANLTAADTTNSNLAKNLLTSHSTGTERAIVGGSFAYIFGPNWNLATNYTDEHKEGTLQSSLLFGSTAAQGNTTNTANTNFIAFLQPIDYTTQRFSMTLANNTPIVQSQYTYSLSRFVNHDAAINLQDPFQTTGLAAGFQSAAYSLPPNNLAQQLKALYNFRLTDATRLAVNFAYGLQMQQDSAYTPETNNASAPLPAGGLPRNAFNGLVQTYLGNTLLTSRPTKDLDLKASYTLDIRDNQSTRDTYRTLINDTTGTIPITLNVPYSFTDQKVNGEAGYKIIPSTKFTGGYTFDTKSRTYSATDRDREYTEYGRLNSTLADDVNGMVGVTISDRRASNYNKIVPIAALGEGTAFADIDGLVHYSEASRQREELKSNLSWTPDRDLSLSVAAKYSDDYYPNSPLGLTSDNRLNVDPDIAWSPMKGLQTHLFYSFEEVFYQLTDSVTPPGSTAPFNWSMGTPNITHTAGLSTDWQATDDLKVGLNYTFQYGSTGFDQSGFGTGSLGTSAFNYSNLVSLPSNTSLTNSIGINGEYQIADRASILFGYSFERFDSVDYLNTQSPTSPFYANAILGTNGNLSYNVHTVNTALRIKF